MKAIVLKDFEDKYTKKLRKVGEEITESKERVEEINSSKFGPFVKVIEVESNDDKKQEEEENNKPTGDENIEEEQESSKSKKGKLTKKAGD